MKKAFFTILVLAALFSPHARAENGGVVTLPGNATLNTGMDSERTIVRIDNDNVSPLVRAIVGYPYKYKPVPLQENIPFNQFNAQCGQTDTVSKRNKCVRDLLREEKRTQSR